MSTPESESNARPPACEAGESDAKYADEAVGAGAPDTATSGAVAADVEEAEDV